MPDKIDRMPPFSGEPVQPAGSDADKADVEEKKAPAEGNGSTGDQLGGQSAHSEAEMDGRIEGLPKQ